MKFGSIWYGQYGNYPPFGVNYTDLSDKDCNLPEKDNTMSVEFIITEELKDLTIRCYDPQAEKYSDSSLVIKETKCEYTLINIQSYVLLH